MNKWARNNALKVAVGASQLACLVAFVFPSIRHYLPVILAFILDRANDFSDSDGENAKGIETERWEELGCKTWAERDEC